LLSALFSAEQAGQVFMGHRNDSENGVILAERFRNTISESRLNGESMSGRLDGD
jgi:hypothetical protein